ncbi:hypothetical protein [Comamonas terrae]|uniref:Integrase n=1 Tax=Comamonas terrae TaxID=673548 RepID=A0ABW5UPD7_9BURK|nr:hypothetical protein [Comamonas terrae]
MDADAQARKTGLDDDEFESASENIAELLPLINRALASGQVGKFHNAVTQLLLFRGYQLRATDAEFQTLTYEVLKYVQTGYKILAARQQGDLQKPPDSSVFPPSLPAAWEAHQPTPTKPAGHLTDITPLYQDHLQTSSAKTRTTYLSIWQRFVDYTNNKPLRSATSADVFDFLESRLHAKEKPWSYGYTSGPARNVLFEAFALSKTKQLIDQNPVAGLEVLPKISAKVEESRLKPRFPYKAKQLNDLFASEWYNPDSAAWRGKMKDDLGARYWIPLLCMWHGLRVGEATQLQIHDVDLAQSLIKIQVAQDHDEIGPERSLKNAATYRVVPIHPTLLALGFLDFVRAITRSYAQGPYSLPRKKAR